MPDSTVYPARTPTVYPDDATVYESSTTYSRINTSTDVMVVGTSNDGITGITTSSGTLA